MAMLVAVVMALAGSPDPEYVALRDALVRDASESQLKAWETGDDWEKRITAMDVRAWQYDHGVASVAWTVEPQHTRQALLRFMDPRLEVPAAAGPLLARLTWGREDADVRVALVDALTRTGGEWAPVLGTMFGDEDETATREVMVQAARRASITDAISLLKLGFGDKAAPVRAAAAETCPWVDAKGTLDGLVLVAMADTDPEVRAEAVRAAGWMRIEASWDPIVRLLGDPDPRVRLQAVKALQRLDPADTASLPGVGALRQDADTKVQRAATEASAQ
ncbi:MAG: HEAT repeat domain-containing protein [Deltaproteobacteria bacterium]|nr:HEAT repeat domain-containing protein [Deltaproteobacteria bacterium]